MSVAIFLQVAVPLVWLGMVLGISFVETPLKFQAPGITVPLGLGIGRLVFTYLNRIELALAVVLCAVLLMDRRGLDGVDAALTIALVVALVVQVGLVRPVVNRRSDRVLAGEELPRSRTHLYYVGLECLKVVLLAALAVMLVGRLTA